MILKNNENYESSETMFKISMNFFIANSFRRNELYGREGVQKN